MAFRYGTERLTVEKVFALVRGELQGVLDEEARGRLDRSRETVERLAASRKAVYGVNTGFGPLVDVKVSPEETSRLQENLLMTHAVGVGEPIAAELSKIMMVCKVHALAQGYSGIRREVVERILYFLGHDLVPVVPSQGSVGASGDLAPLAHLFLPLLGRGYFFEEGRVVPAGKVLARHGLEPLRLHAKEGLALINGTQFILAHAVAGLERMAWLLDLADLAGAMSLEGFEGSASPFREELHAIRPYRGTQESAAHMRQLLEGSGIIASHRNCGRVQDPYSLRCIPQVHGASRNAWYHLRELVETELNSVTDNPVILDTDEAVSGGNFHGEPLALALDYAALAAAELGNISDRRCYLLLEGKFGLPRLLTRNGGLNSGYMIPQYTTAALVSENKVLCTPASADSIPTSLGQEDLVSMGAYSARKFLQVLNNVEKILAIELMYAAQAIDFRRPLHSSAIIEENYRIIRKEVPRLEDDRPLKEDIDKMIRLVRERKLIVR